MQRRRPVPGRLSRAVSWGLFPKRKWRISRVGLGYLGSWILLLAVGLHQQANLVLLIAGMAAGPVVASWLVSAAMLRRIRVHRRAPQYIFAGEPLVIDYCLENLRRSNAVLAMELEDAILPDDRAIPGAKTVYPRVTFDRVPATTQGRIRWQAPTPSRGLYRCNSLELVTRAPFGLIERHLVVSAPEEILIYPKIGRLSRRWQQLHRESTQTKRGRRHDRTAQQQEYHGLREYRPGDSPRWIHWRTTGRIGKPMIKEFEHQNDQDLAILLDLWLPRVKATHEQREAIEAALRFAATACVEASRQSGRRIILGWTGPNPGVLQGVSSTKLLHEQLGALAVMKPAMEGQVSGLLDALPPACLRESLLVLISSRPVNLIEEFERSTRLASAGSRGLAGRVIVLDSSHGDLEELIQFDNPPAKRPVAVRGEP